MQNPMRFLTTSKRQHIQNSDLSIRSPRFPFVGRTLSSSHGLGASVPGSHIGLTLAISESLENELEPSSRKRLV